MPRLHLPITLPLLLLVGCSKLIDQRTFAPAPEANSTTTAHAIDTRTPLMTIGPGTKLATYEKVLRTAVREAEARDPAVSYDVISVVPGSGTVAEQVKAADADRASATEVAQALIAAGVPEDRVDLGARPDPGVHSPDVRVYVR